MAEPHVVHEILQISKQQRIERHYFDQFKEFYPLPAGTVNFGDKPDVIISGTRKIGIEVTNLFVADGGRPDSIQTQRKGQEAVIAAAQRLFQRETELKRGFLFGFNEEHPIGGKRRQEALAKEIAEMALKVDGDDNGQIRRRQFEHIPELKFAYMIGHSLKCPPFSDPQFPDGPPDSYRDFVEYRNRQDAHGLRHGIRHPLHEFPKWRLKQVYSLGLMSIERLLEIVGAKEQKTAHYCNCDAYWLLVVVDFIDPAQEQEILVDDLGEVQSKIFDKIIVYRTGFNDILDIES